jgi:dihydrofolate reductase
VTLDGVMEDPFGADGFDRGGWSLRFPDPAAARVRFEELAAAEAILLGRVTYGGLPAAWRGEVEELGAAERLGSIRKYVASNTLRELPQSNSQVLSGDPAAAVRELKAGDGGEILLLGSRTLLATLIANELIDEYRLMIHPIILGAGRHLFPNAGDGGTLRLSACRALDSGTVIASYVPVRD